MSYRFEEAEPVPAAVGRIARERIDHALDQLRSDPDEDAIHEARKDMKKLRALLRLARDELGDDVYRQENECFRDVARELSGARDADVMLGTLERLDGSFPSLRRALNEHREAQRGEGPGNVITVLAEARGRVGEWPFERDGFEAIEGGLRRIYRRGRRALRAVEHEPTTALLHEWRKREKDLWYHLTLLRECWPPLLKASADEAHELSDLLGADHDLAVLRDWAHEHTDPPAGLDEAIERQRAALQRDALALGRRLYAECPRAFAARLGGYWEAWAAQRAQSPVTTSSAAAG